MTKIKNERRAVKRRSHTELQRPVTALSAESGRASAGSVTVLTAALFRFLDKGLSLEQLLMVTTSANKYGKKRSSSV